MSTQLMEIACLAQGQIDKDDIASGLTSSCFSRDAILEFCKTWQKNKSDGSPPANNQNCYKAKTKLQSGAVCIIIIITFPPFSTHHGLCITCCRLNFFSSGGALPRHPIVLIHLFWLYFLKKKRDHLHEIIQLFWFQLHCYWYRFWVRRVSWTQRAEKVYLLRNDFVAIDSITSSLPKNWRSRRWGKSSLNTPNFLQTRVRSVLVSLTPLSKINLKGEMFMINRLKSRQRSTCSTKDCILLRGSRRVSLPRQF